MKRTIFLWLLLSQVYSARAADTLLLVSVAKNFLYAVKTNQPYEQWKTALASAPEDAVTAQLVNDQLKKAFWLNVYNAAVQLLLKQQAAQYSNRHRFFSAKQVAVAGHLLSLDFIEHGILRRSKNKLAKGYLNKWFSSSLEKKWRVDALDQRIHFALNCGARSCPPVAYYDAARIDQQLTMAMKGFLQAECDYDSSSNTVQVPKLFSWFKGDFGGKKGILQLLREAGVLEGKNEPAIRYKPYNWTMVLNQYKDW